MTRPTPLALALPALLAGATAIALAPIFVRLSETGPVSTAFYRLFLSLPPLWLAVTLFDRAIGTRRVASRMPWLALSGFCFAADLATWHWSIVLTSVSSATLFANFAPIWVTLGAWLFLGERIAGGFIAGLVIALSGAALVMGVSMGVGNQLAGDLLAMVAGVFYGGYLLLTKFTRAQLSTATVMFYSAVASAACLLPAAWLSEGVTWPASLDGWLVLVALALVSHVGGQGLIAFSLAHLPVAFSSVALLFQPVLATAFAWWLLAEPIGWWQGVGGIVVLAGIAIAHRYSVGRS